MNPFPLWWRHTAVSAADAKENSRPPLNCCWHPHQLLLRLLPLLCFILRLHLLTSSSLLSHVAQCSDIGWGLRPCGNFFLAVAHGWMWVSVRAFVSAACIRAALSEAGWRQKLDQTVQPWGCKKLYSPSLASGVAQTLQKEWETANFAAFVDPSEDVELMSLSSVKKKKLWWHLLMIITAEDPEPFPVIQPSVKKVRTGPTRHLSCSVTRTLTLNSCCIHHLRTRPER